jgi:hypothetical protein
MSVKNRPKVNFIGRKYGRLTVIEELNDGLTLAEGRLKCLCDCGKIHNISRLHKKPQSCGCLQKEAAKKSGEKNRKYRKTTFTRAYHNHKNGARMRGYKALIRKDWDNIISKPCYYCGNIDIRDGLRSNQTGKTKDDINISKEERLLYLAPINGIDRKDNSLGYKLDNVVPCCSWCNKMKGNHSETAFLEQIKKIYKTSPNT